MSLPPALGTRWRAWSTRAGYREDPIPTWEVAAEITRIERAGGTVRFRDWYGLDTWGTGEGLTFRPMWVRRAPTPGTWRALHHLTHLPELRAARGRGEGLRVGCGDNLGASNTTWSLIERGLVEVDGDTARITAIGWRLAAAHRRWFAAQATRRVLHAARQRQSAAQGPNTLVRAA